MVALLMAQYAEQVQSIGVLLFPREQLLIQPSRSSELTRLVHFDSGRQNVWHV